MVRHRVLHPQCNMLKYLKRLSRYSTPCRSTTKQGLGVQWEEAGLGEEGGGEDVCVRRCAVGGGLGGGEDVCVRRCAEGVWKVWERS